MLTYSVRTKGYKVVALNVSALVAASELVDHMKASGLGVDSYVVIVGGKVLSNVQQWIDALAQNIVG